MRFFWLLPLLLLFGGAQAQVPRGAASADVGSTISGKSLLDVPLPPPDPCTFAPELPQCQGPKI